MKRSARADIKFRFSEIDKNAINRAERTVPMSFSSEYPAVQIADEGVPDHIRRAAGLEFGEQYIEILDHSPGNVDLSVLRNRGPFLDEHDPKDQLGSFDDAQLDPETRRTHGVVRMDTHAKASERLDQMYSKSRAHVSAGYGYTKFLGNELLPNGMTAKRFAWRAKEVSSVAMPADPTIGVERNLKDLSPVDLPGSVNVEALAKNLSPEQRDKMKRSLFLLDPAPALTAPAGGGGAAPAAAPAVDEGQIRTRSLNEERTRVKEISATADRLAKDHPHAAEKIRSVTNEAIASDMSLKDYQIRAMTEVLGAQPAKKVTMAAIGMNEREQNEYSILRGIQSCLMRRNQQPDGLEGEVHQAMLKRNIGVDFEGFAVPADVRVRCRNNGTRGMSRRDRRIMQRDLQVNVFNQGGATVATELVTPIIEILRNRMVTQELGVQTMAGLEGNIAIPRQTGAATAYALPESATLTKSTQALDQIPMNPRRVGAWNDYTRQLLLQSSIDVENFIRDDLMKVIAIKWDYLILQGQGSASEPMGILNTPGIGSILFGGTATWAQIVSFETALNQANALQGRLGWATTPGVKGRWKAVAKTGVGVSSVVPIFLWGDDGEVNGYEAEATNQILNNQVYFGNWEEVIHGLWGGYDVIVNPYSRDTDGAVRVTINTFGDVAIRHPVSFCVSVDAGNQ